MLDVITDNLDVWTTAQKQKKAVGSGRAKKDESYGIKKLRELILELAVRGKLVPQDDSDEPASVLLEKIEEEKQKLIEKGEIKRQKPLPVFSEKASLSEPPNNWVWSRLGDISFINPRNIVEDETITSFVPMPLVLKSHTGEHGQEHRTWGDIKKGYTHFANNDIGLAKITPCFENSKAVVFSNLKNGIGAGTTELHIARPYGATLNSRYILLYLKSPDFLLTGESRMTGTAGQKRIPKTFFSENPLPLPPLAEQQRIVAKVDELMSLCDQLEQEQADHQATHQTLVETLLKGLIESATLRHTSTRLSTSVQGKQDSTEHPEPRACRTVEGHASTSSAQSGFGQAWSLIAEHFDTLFTTEQSIDLLKQTILQLAVMGKLVPQNPKDEPASVLLEKIAKEKEKLIEEGKIKKQKALPEIEEDEKPFGLPDGWEWTRFGGVSEFINGDRGKNYPNKSEYVDNGIPWINTGHIDPNGTLSELRMNYITKEKFDSLGSGKIQKNDLVYCLRGATFGKTSFVTPFKEGAIASSLMIIRPSEELSKEYLYTFLKSPEGEKQLRRFDNGSAQPNLSANKVKLYAYPLPPVEEQQCIVTKVNELLTLCDSLKANLNQAQTTQTQLADAIVKQAVS